ncbi:MAG TPA: glutamine synthetase family protein [Solirubrobacteraceae bacterium]|jgi:glutamine synthetase|nr:glutamine synthetase family protein [Solirubrobacteraceae bacterium]
MSGAQLTALVTCDLGAIVRGRAVLTQELEGHLQRGVGWVPANLSLTPLGSLAEHSPFDSRGDLRLLADIASRARVDEREGDVALDFVLCDIVETDGSPWGCCPRLFLREALRELEQEFSLRVQCSFEHEFQLLRENRAAPPFSLEAQRRAEPFASGVMAALEQAGAAPERFFAEFAPHQYELPVAPAEGLAAADRAVVLREVVRDVARGSGLRATFVPLLDPAAPGNGVHIHLRLLDAAGGPALHRQGAPGHMSPLGMSFAAGILRHARALSALTAPSPVSGARLAPHHWSAGAVSLGERNREALLRIPPLVELGGGELEPQLRLEYRGADAAANPYLALGAIVRAGLEGLRHKLPPPALLEVDPTGLEGAEAQRFGVGALPATLAQALDALDSDNTVRGWMDARMYEAYVGIKRAELDAAGALDAGELCTRYAHIY